MGGSRRVEPEDVPRRGATRQGGPRAKTMGRPLEYPAGSVWGLGDWNGTAAPTCQAILTRLFGGSSVRSWFRRSSSGGSGTARRSPGSSDSSRRCLPWLPSSDERVGGRRDHPVYLLLVGAGRHPRRTADRDFRLVAPRGICCFGLRGVTWASDASMSVKSPAALHVRVAGRGCGRGSA